VQVEGTNADITIMGYELSASAPRSGG
jgi:hypothetical protein